MSAYSLYLTASLLFYTAGILMIASSNRPSGVAFIALGSTFFALALNRRKKTEVRIHRHVRTPL